MARNTFCILGALLAVSLTAQGTKQWTESRYEQFEKGEAHHAAIRNDGRLEAAPALTTRFTTTSTYLWSMDADASGNACLGTGATQGGSSVVCVAPDGHPTTRARFPEPGVQAIRMLSDGSVLAATAPEGKLYRIAPGQLDLKPQVLFDPATTSEKPKYLWAMALDGDSVLLATGTPALIYRVPLKVGQTQVFFRSGDQHIRSLLLAADGKLYAGSDGAGIVYRIERDGKAFALYSAGRREVTSLALDAKGNLYIAAVGARGASTLPPLAPSGAAVATIVATSGATSYAMTNAIAPDGSEIDRIAPDGMPEHLVVLKDEVVYALAVHNDKLLAATGNRGKVLSISTEVPGRYTDLAHTESGQVTAMAPMQNGLLLATSNNGKLLELSNALAADASFTSDVFDAQAFSLWGHAETETGSPDTKTPHLLFRSGNIENPQSSSGDFWSAWKTDVPPPARYIQWKAELQSGTSLSSVRVNYLQRNLAPQIDDLVVQTGAHVAATPSLSNTNVSISFTPVPTAPPSADTAPLSAERRRGSITARWQAHDDNGDELLFAVFYRDVHEHNWHLLHERVKDRYYSFDSSLLPDGVYELRVVASDEAAHTTAETLHAERASDSFVVDTTPPVIDSLTAQTEKDRIHIAFGAHDVTSPIVRAEYSVDAGLWQYLEPVGHISDSQNENYDFSLDTLHPSDTHEHVVAVRVFDRYDNSVSAKVIVK